MNKQGARNVIEAVQMMLVFVIACIALAVWAALTGEATQPDQAVSTQVYQMVGQMLTIAFGVLLGLLLGMPLLRQMWARRVED